MGERKYQLSEKNTANFSTCSYHRTKLIVVNVTENVNFYIHVAN